MKSKKLTDAQVIEAENAIAEMEKRLEDLMAESRGEMSGSTHIADDLKKVMESPLSEFHKKRIKRCVEAVDNAMEKLGDYLTDARQWCEDY